MPSWESCTTRVDYEDGSAPCLDEDTDVRIEGDQLLVCYWDDVGAVVFDGVEEAPGRFACTARSRPRKAKLSWDPEARTLRGTFEEGGLRGTLHIELPAG